jgi:hypothetical protein
MVGMDDQEILRRIHDLVDEEHELEGHVDAKGITAEQQDRLQKIEVALDQCWDLLRQRRARRDAGQDPDGAVVRGAGTVEGYQQ